MKHLGTNAL